MTPSTRRLVASALIAALAAAGVPAFAAPSQPQPSASLTGTVFSGDLATPLPGATVVATDARGARVASAPTGADGAFTIAGMTAGRWGLALETPDGSFAVATPITLAPAETKGVHLALRGKNDGDKDDKDDKKPAGYWTTGGKASMIAVLVGFVVAGAVAINQQNDDAVLPASPSNPD